MSLARGTRTAMSLALVNICGREKGRREGKGGRKGNKEAKERGRF